MDTYQTRVVFRMWNGGEKGKAKKYLIALFPDIEEYFPGTVLSYEHIGQHGAALYNRIIMESRPATPTEYADLAAELASLGYDLKIALRR